MEFVSCATELDTSTGTVWLQCQSLRGLPPGYRLVVATSDTGVQVQLRVVFKDMALPLDTGLQLNFPGSSSRRSGSALLECNQPINATFEYSLTNVTASQPALRLQGAVAGNGGQLELPLSFLGWGSGLYRLRVACTNSSGAADPTPAEALFQLQ